MWYESVDVYMKISKSSSSSTSGSSGGISGDRGDVFNSADLHAISGESSHGSLSSRAGGLSFDSSFSSHLDVESVDFEVLASVDDIKGSQHSGIRGRLFSVWFDFHAAGDSDESFSAGEVGHVDEGVIPGGQDVAHAEHKFSRLHLRA